MKNPNNFCVIMAGGFGSRFWPLCSVKLQNPRELSRYVRERTLL